MQEIAVPAELEILVGTPGNPLTAMVRCDTTLADLVDILHPIASSPVNAPSLNSVVAQGVSCATTALHASS